MSRTVRVIFGVGAALLMVGAASGVVAQEATPVVPKYPLAFVIMHEVDSGDLFEYRDVMAKFVAANKQHDNGGMFAAYTAITGGPKETFYYLYPMEKLADMAGWTPPANILTDVFGPKEGSELLNTIGALTGGGANWISGQAQRMTNLDPESVGHTPRFVYFIHVQVDPGHMDAYRAAVMKMVAANQKHENGMHWSASYKGIGANEGGPEFGFAIGFDRFAEVDEWPDMMTILADQYGEEEAKNIISTMNKYSTGEAHFLAMEPELSNWPMSEE